MNKEQIIDNILELLDKLRNIEEDEEKQSEEWTPEINEAYWFVNFHGGKYRIDFHCWNDGDTDRNIKENTLIFKTRAEAEEYEEYLTAKKKAINEFSDEEWRDDGIEKYTYYYDYDCREIETTGSMPERYNLPYFRTMSDCRKYINKYKKFILQEFNVNEKDDKTKTF